MWDDTRVYSVTGSLEGSYSGSYQITVGTAPRKYPRGDTFIASSSTEIYGAISYSKQQQRRALNRELLGETGSSPSWTHDNIGANQAFFAMPFSASHHERDVLHLVESGSFVEQRVSVPLTASLFYRKPRTLVHRIYKLSASAETGVFSSLLGSTVPSGSTVDSPKIFSINVPDSGKIVDVKVWVEIVHNSGNRPTSTTGRAPALQTLGLALRSPNVSWANGNAHPLKNFRNGAGNQSVHNFAGVTMLLDDPFEVPPTFYKDTYLLWESPGLFTLSVHFTDDGAEPVKSMTWNNDRHMRTVFTDGANVRNPRDLYTSFVTDEGHGPTGNTHGSPSGKGLGAGVPWTTDGNIELIIAGSTYAAAGSPPPGWLTGPGGEAAVNEFPTTGSNLGCAFLRPVYPLLDDVIQKKVAHFAETTGTAGRSNWRKWESPVRPGLRGTEVSGTWQLLVANQVAHSATLALSTNTGTIPNDTYFRQWRLELIFEQGVDSRFVIPSKLRRASTVTRRKGLHPISVNSGSAWSIAPPDTEGDFSMADYNLNANYVFFGEEMELRRTVGLITSSLDLDVAEFAVYTSPVSASFPSSSYDRSQVLEILKPSNPLAGPNTLSSYVRNKVPNVSTQDLARIQLSGSS